MNLTIGQRVRLRHDVDRYPDFIARAGSEGVLIESPVADAVAVALDDPPAGSEAWEGIVFWYVGIEGHDWEADLEPLDGPIQHDCMEHAVPITTDGPLGHGWECGECGAFLQAG